jgi:A/G-specific adenine glycosylase
LRVASTVVKKPVTPKSRREFVVDSALQAIWPTGRWRADFRRRLVAWYGRNARKLPWRRNRDPYRVWISEIMLQQTTVAAVVPYFERFMLAMPTIASLAAADEDMVLRLWEGLGYYRRARQLHRGAKTIVAEHKGRFPHDAEAVRRLPGIGRYTSGAILSIAFDQPLPILEANTTRLLSRLLAYRGDVARADALRLLWRAAETLLPRRGAGRFNQALMELGSQICRPREPACLKCPIANLCPTHRDGLHNLIPAARRKSPIEEVREAAVIIRRHGRVLLIRRAEGQRWAGYWDFPRLTCDRVDRRPARSELTSKIHEQTGIVIEEPRHLATLHHTVTRFRITLECFEAECCDSKQARRSLKPSWVHSADLREYPLSSTGRRIARLLDPGW